MDVMEKLFMMDVKIVYIITISIVNMDHYYFLIIYLIVLHRCYPLHPIPPFLVIVNVYVVNILAINRSIILLTQVCFKLPISHLQENKIGDTNFDVSRKQNQSINF